MELEVATALGKYIGAGLACTGMGGAAVGVGHVVGNYLSGALRNPSAAGGQTDGGAAHAGARQTGADVFAQCGCDFQFHDLAPYDGMVGLRGGDCRSVSDAGAARP